MYALYGEDAIERRGNNKFLGSISTSMGEALRAAPYCRKNLLAEEKRKKRNADGTAHAPLVDVHSRVLLHRLFFFLRGCSRAETDK